MSLKIVFALDPNDPHRLIGLVLLFDATLASQSPPKLRSASLIC